MAAVPTQIGIYQTVSTPGFLNGVLWFQGTNNQLWSVPVANPSAGINPNGFLTASSPAPALDGNVYFQGTDNTLWSCGQTWPYLQNKVSIYQCASAPAAPGDGNVYFQGTDNTLWQVHPGIADSGVSSQTTQSSPFLALGGCVAYYQYTSALLLASSNFADLDSSPALVMGPPGVPAGSPPYMGSNGILYFQLASDITVGGIAYVANALMQVDMTQNPPVLSQFGNWQCISTPKMTQFGQDGFLYFQGTDTSLWQVSIADPTQHTKLDHTFCSPCVPGNGFVYYMGKGNGNLNNLMQCATAQS